MKKGQVRLSEYFLNRYVIITGLITMHIMSNLGCCQIVPPDLLYQIIKEGTSEQKDKFIHTLELSEILRTQRSIIAGMRSGGNILKVAGHLQKRRIVYDANHADDIFSISGGPKRYEEDIKDTGDSDVDSCFS